MIISRIQYGLGNQLFQYALGKRLALDRGQELKLDISWFDDNGIDPKIKVRDYLMRHFTVHEPIASKAEIHRFRYFEHDLPTRIKMKYRKIFGTYPGLGYVLEKGRHEGESQYDEAQLLSGPNLFLEGCWQWYDYFSSIDDHLKNHLQFKPIKDEINTSILDKIDTSNSVGVHIRKGDYLHPEFIDNLGKVCGTSYYQRAFSVINESVPKPRYFLFSDDFDWVRKNLSLYNKVHDLIEANSQGEAHKDMYLLSRCKHMILSNSTFSWWAAWFNRHKDNYIISPSNWRMGSNQQHPGKNSWIKI